MKKIVLQVDEKNKIKFDKEEQQYIYYRVIDKSEMAAHLASANNKVVEAQTILNTFQSYIDDERVVEPKEAIE